MNRIAAGLLLSFHCKNVPMTETTNLLCPACKVDLVMTERKDVEIDYCPKCRGVWLDRGELDEIIKKSAAQEQAPSKMRHRGHEGYGEHGEYGERGYGYRRKSWLSKIFD